MTLDRALALDVVADGKAHRLYWVGERDGTNLFAVDASRAWLMTELDAAALLDAMRSRWERAVAAVAGSGVELRELVVLTAHADGFARCPVCLDAGVVPLVYTTRGEAPRLARDARPVRCLACP